MRHFRFGLLLTAAALAWGQGGGRRGAQAPGPTTPSPATPAAPGGRGGRGATGAVDFYNYSSTAGSGAPLADVRAAETQQQIPINGQALAYTTHVAHLPILNATTGQPEAHIFYTFYAKADPEDRKRPVVMFFGGAPGVSAAFQEFGGLGPKRMRPLDSATGPDWADNPQTLLPQADLVFANPVGTAFSRPVQPAGGAAFWNTDGDIASLAEFIRGFLRKHNRQASPLFLAGEDFGCGRVAGLAAYLADHQIPVRGIILFSLTPSADAVAGDTLHLNTLPTFVMTAWRHKKLAPELNNVSPEQIAGDARHFASRDYLHALYKGDRMTEAERAKTVANLARFTGLSKSFLTANDLRVAADRFASELLRDQRRTVAFSDTRVAGFVPVASGGRGGGFFAAAGPPLDFRMAQLAPEFLSAYDAYLRQELKYTGNRDAIYYLTSGGVSNFVVTGNDDASLANAFARNPELRLFVASNYYDLAAPFYAVEYTVAHLSVSPEVRAKNISLSHVEAGQMPYFDSRALAKLHRDLAGFLEQATK